MHHELHLAFHIPKRTLSLSVALALLTLGLAGPVLAADDAPQEVEVKRTKVTSAIVTRLDTLPETEPNWFRANIRLAKKNGFAYSRRFSPKNRDTDIIFSVKGPMIRKKTPGLTFEIRF